MTRAIEPHLRSGPPPGARLVAVRGGPLTVEKLLEQAAEEARRYTWRGAPMFAVSVFCAVDGWTIETILSELLSTRSTYATATIGALAEASFGVLPSHRSPHFDVLLAEASETAAGTLLALLGPPERNPYRRRR